MRARARLICSRLALDSYAARGEDLSRTLEIAALFRDFGMPDPQLDAILLNLPLLHASPPGWPFVLAFHTQAETSCAGWLAFIALFPSKTTSIAAYAYVSFEFLRCSNCPRSKTASLFSSHRTNRNVIGCTSCRMVCFGSQMLGVHRYWSRLRSEYIGPFPAVGM